MAERLEGVLCAIPTPFSDNEEFDKEAEKRLREVIEFVIGGKIQGIIPAAGAGEFFLLSEDERKKVIGLTLEQVAGRMPVFAGTGASATREAIMYSKYAEDAGADGVMVVAPYYSLPSENEIYEFYKAVAESVTIPIMIYNDPFPTGVDIRPPLIARLAEIDNINYVKESSGNLIRIQEIMRLCQDKITVFYGDNYPVFDAFLLGAKGWVTLSFFPLQASRLYRLAVKERDMEKAREVHTKLLPILQPTVQEDITQPSSYIAVQKAAFELLGIPVGPPRKPLSPLSDKQKALLRKRLIAAGILEK